PQPTGSGWPARVRKIAPPRPPSEAPTSARAGVTTNVPPIVRTARYARIDDHPLAANATRLSCCWLTMSRNTLSLTRLMTVSPRATTIPAAAPAFTPAQPRPPVFGGQGLHQVGELVAVALAPPARVQPDEGLHASASRIRPTWATSRACSRYTRS